MSRFDIALPAENRDWSGWRRGRVVQTGHDLADLAGSGEGILIGVPAGLCTTFSFRVPTTQAELFGPMVKAQADKRGLGSGGHPLVATWTVISQDQGETRLSADVLGHDLPETMGLPKATGYAASARLYRLPSDRLTLWQEHQRWVLAANLDGRLTHTQVMSAPVEDAAALAQEVGLCALLLQGEGVAPENAELQICAVLDPAWMATFRQNCLVPVEFTAPLVPDQRLVSAALRDQRLVPASVVAARRRATTRRRLALAACLIAAVYLAAGAILWRYSVKVQGEIASLQETVDQNRPQVEEIVLAEQRWQAIEPAFDVRHFPLVQLNEIAGAMPPSGVVIKEFRTSGQSVTVTGQARDVQLAHGLVEAMNKNPRLRGYEWAMPNPKVEKNNAASFDIRGTWKYAKSQQ